MANADSVKAKIQSLIDTANNITGNNDLNLTDAIDSLINNVGGNSELPELTNAGTASDLLLGKELINEHGVKITGTIPHDTYAFWAQPALSSSGNVYVAYPATEQRRIVGDGATLQSHIKKEYFGDASPEEVLAGKTFTSASGLMVTGTLTAQTYYVGYTDPDDSFGNDGDLYFVRGE
jgi:hypothetical protein